MNGLDKAILLHLAMDGPNINWNVLNILKLYKNSEDSSCTQHTVHGALKDGFQKSSWKIDDLLKCAFWLLNDSSK